MENGLTDDGRKAGFNCSKKVIKASIRNSTDLDRLAPVAIITYKVRK